MSFAVSARGRTHQPCAACRMLRRRCDPSCTLAPYFPSEEVEKFAGVHKVFGASNVIKMIQMVEERKREDAVNAIVYEARARLKDPVYGSTGAIFYLQKTVEELKIQLEWATARASELQEQRDGLLGILMNVHQVNDFVVPITADEPAFSGSSFSVDDTVTGYDPLNFPLECDWSL
ncbi:LOB domain-containing protein 1-like [Malania oleifera]|uniref:LOB domain-containing protein 1-like n=1 Tax=Malania oleifera TaxID=397392 RepID=UPI0025AE9B98|nr:LOB domain-containing protein 1-like [Malania oleifera]